MEFSKLMETLASKFDLENIISITIDIVVILIFAAILGSFAKKAVHKFFLLKNRVNKEDERRDTTLLKLLENVITYIVGFIAILMILDKLGVNIQSILAGAGILGLAVGFGAQSLVKDIITGFFVIFEDQFSVGDYVRINQFEGYVLQIGLRITTVRAVSGEVQIIPNGNILEVTNFSIENSVSIIDIGVAYEESIENTEKVLQELLLTLPDKYEDILETPELLGVQTLGPSEVVYRITCETKPMRHFQVSRIIRKEIKEAFDKYGIEIPYPKMVYYNRQTEESV